MNLKNRLINFIDSKQMSIREFERKCGFSNGYIRGIREGIGADKLEIILQNFPELNRAWLLFGEGDMLLSHPKQNAVIIKRKTENSHLLVPLIPTNAKAGFLQGFSDGFGPDDCPLVPSPVPGADIAIQISGDSMEPDYRNGSLLFLKKINSDVFIPWGHDVVLDTENGPVFKKIFRGDDYPQYIIARSINPDYPDLEIDTSGIYGIYRVVGSSFINSTI